MNRRDIVFLFCPPAKIKQDERIAGILFIAFSDTEVRIEDLWINCFEFAGLGALKYPQIMGGRVFAVFQYFSTVCTQLRYIPTLGPVPNL